MVSSSARPMQLQQRMPNATAGPMQQHMPNAPAAGSPAPRQQLLNCILQQWRRPRLAVLRAACTQCSSMPNAAHCAVRADWCAIALRDACRLRRQGALAMAVVVAACSGRCGARRWWRRRGGGGGNTRSSFALSVCVLLASCVPVSSLVDAHAFVEGFLGGMGQAGCCCQAICTCAAAAPMPSTSLLQFAEVFFARHSSLGRGQQG